MKAGFVSFIIFAALALFCVLIYWPGLQGSFVYDDSTFLIDNEGIRITSLELADWVRAALSFPSGVHQGRWLGMLSFGANYYFTGLDPFWLKLTNVAIHVVNGLLVFAMLRSLFTLWREVRPGFASVGHINISLAAAVLAGIWLVLPINLTAVLYVSQRLESLSNTFVFLGLYLYLRGRLSMWRGERGALVLWVPIVLCTGAGLLVKESAALLPLYAACAEFALCAFRDRRARLARPVIALHTIVIGSPLIIGTIWLATWIGGATTYARPFGTMERLLTESRVMFDYIHWIALPSLDALTLFHDDIPLSKGLFDPPTTLFAVLGVVALLALAIGGARRRPLASLGVLWFFAGHVLTGTIIPLLLAFEHRNYFPSIGVLLFAASFVTLEGGIVNTRLRASIAVLVLAFYGGTTWMRAEEWSDPLRLTMSEAAKRPDSPGAQYELGRTFIFATRSADKASLRAQGLDVLKRAAKLPGASIIFEQLLIVAHAAEHEPIDPELWQSMISKIEKAPPSSPDIEALKKLLHCFEARICTEGKDALARVFAAASARVDASPVVRTQYAQFAMDFLHDDAIAERELRLSIEHTPNDAISRQNLVTFLIERHRYTEAANALDDLRRLNVLGSRNSEIAELAARIRKGKAATKPASGAGSPPSSPGLEHGNDSN